MLKMRLLDTGVATAAESKGPYPLRDGRFDPCSSLVSHFCLLAVHGVPRGVQRFLLSLRLEGQRLGPRL
jgi:hypothetical protein